MEWDFRMVMNLCLIGGKSIFKSPIISKFVRIILSARTLRPYSIFFRHVNRCCLSEITSPGQVKIQIVREVNWGQYKNKLLIWLFSDMPNSWDMAQYVKNRPKMKTEKTEKWWYFLKDDDHRWSFGNRNIGGNYWKTAKT